MVLLCRWMVAYTRFVSLDHTRSTHGCCPIRDAQSAGQSRMVLDRSHLCIYGYWQTLGILGCSSPRVWVANFIIGPYFGFRWFGGYNILSFTEKSNRRDHSQFNIQQHYYTGTNRNPFGCAIFQRQAGSSMRLYSMPKSYELFYHPSFLSAMALYISTNSCSN